MNRYSLIIKTNFNNGYDEWEFTVLADDSKEFVMSVILETQKECKYESPVELMDYVCDVYGWQWEDYSPDILIEM